MLLNLGILEYKSSNMFILHEYNIKTWWCLVIYTTLRYSQFRSGGMRNINIVRILWQ